jgi:hypothetical protein
VSGKRGGRVAPPAGPGHYELRFATSEAVKDWEELCRQDARNTRAAYEAIESDPCPAPHEDTAGTGTRLLGTGVAWLRR